MKYLKEDESLEKFTTEADVTCDESIKEDWSWCDL